MYCFRLFCLIKDGTRAITDLRQMYKLNERQPVTITCEAVGNPLPDPSHIVLFGTDNTQILHARTRIFDNLNSTRGPTSLKWMEQWQHREHCSLVLCSLELTSTLFTAKHSRWKFTVSLIKLQGQIS